MAKGGGGGVGDFQPIQAYEKFTPPRKWVFKKITPRLCDRFKILPPPPSPTLRTRRAYNCEIAYNTCSGRVPTNQNPVQGHL